MSTLGRWGPLGAALALSLLNAPAAGEAPASRGMLGFTERRVAEQLALEKRYDGLIDAADLRAWMQRMAAEPNHVGSPQDKANAEFMLGLFREWGFEARIETFSVLYPTPKQVALEMTAPTAYRARLAEPPVSGDATSARVTAALPPYNVYARDGDVSGELVYVNEGMPDDYEELARHGISVQGRIVIARYGGGWRGLKPKLAHEHGAIGCLIYSDPKDDGYGEGDPYPRGAWRPEDGVQRGSVADVAVGPGDPLTPGVGATEGATRLAVAESRVIAKIPCLPISYGDARPLLAALQGEVVPERWRGSLPLTYHFGPGPATVHLTVESEWSRKEIYDVIAFLRGAELPDEWVIRGNHHDGWVFGAWDPLSGNGPLLAEAKAVGALARSGWRPRRTMVFASWDGEEPGLLGSTEWCEAHAEELQRKAVLYLNCDSNTRGFLSAGGSHAWQALVNQVGEAVRDPEKGVSVLARLRAHLLVEGARRGADETAKNVAALLSGGAAPPLRALGSGSDYTPFLQHLGIATLALSYNGEDEQDGVYHSNYDTFEHYERFGDPGFAYGVLLAQTIGRVLLRTANADVLPLHAAEFSETVGRYVAEVQQREKSLREETERRDALLSERAYELAADPARHEVAPPREAPVPFLNLAALANAARRLQESSRRFDQTYAQALTGGRLDEARRQRIGKMLQALEQSLLDPDGLPGRAWYRHLVYAPGIKTGYAVKTLPGVREAIEGRRWEEAERYAVRTGAALDRYSDQLDRIAAELAAAGAP